jgi:glycosyltransferase involved in cell wall biosynthesis
VKASVLETFAKQLVDIEPESHALAEWLAYALSPSRGRAGRAATRLFRAGNISAASAIVANAADRSRPIVREMLMLGDFKQRLPELPPRHSLRRGGGVAAGDAVAYVAGSGPPYHLSGYTIRTHELLKALGGDLAVACYVRPGFPHDRTHFTRRQGFAPETIESHSHEVTVDSVRYLYTALGADEGAPGDSLARMSQALCVRLEANRPRLVQAASNYYTALPALMAARRLGVPFVYELRGLWELTAAAKRGTEQTESFRLLRALEVRTAEAADHVFTITEGIAEEMAAHGVDRRKMSILPNGIDADCFSAVAKDAALVHKHAIRADDFIIVYSGSTVFYEGIDDIILAAGLLRARGINARLLVVGTGAHQGALISFTGEQSAEGYVTFVGPVTPDVSRRYLSLADAVALPRKPYRLCELVSPLKPFEAMAMEKPVVVSDLRALREIVEDGVTGLITPPSDPVALAGCLEALARDRNLGAALGRRARHWVASERSWMRNAAIVKAVWNSLLQ